MSPISPNEKRFEEHIERELNSLNFCSKNYKDYDKDLCLIKDEVIDFIKDTQPEKWAKLTEINGIQTEKITNKFMISKIISLVEEKVNELKSKNDTIK